MRVRFTELANEDLRQAYSYIAQDSPAKAQAVLERLEKTIDMLSLYPALGREGRIKGTREFIVSSTPYIIVYRAGAVENTLEILSVLHSSKKYP